jgi:hypothetical protein
VVTKPIDSGGSLPTSDPTEHAGKVELGGVDLAARPVTNDSIDTALCTLEGVDHDFRPRTYRWMNTDRTSWVCVWCNGVACGDYSEADPCWRIYHHDDPHRSRAGEVWPLGGNRA